MMIYNRETDFLHRLYDPDWHPLYQPYKYDDLAIQLDNINEIIWVDFYNDKKGTLLDYVYNVRDETENWAVEEGNDFWRHLTHWEERLREWGGRRMRELENE